MEIRQLRAFAAIAETGTFTAGALRVHVTQAAVSMQIRQLETETGVRLFVRAPRRVVLTEAGEALIARARTILREHDAALAEMHEMTGAEYGRLRIGSASSGVSTEQLPRILKELRKQHARAEVSLSTATSAALVRQILDGDMDVAFVSLPVEARGIRTELLVRDELVAIASPRHLLAKQHVITAQALANEKLILGERGGNTRRLIDQFFARAGVHPTITMELSRLAGIKRMVEEELGVGIVPLQSAREEVAAGRLVTWWVKGAQFDWELGLAHVHDDGNDSPVRQTFIRLCREHFGAPRRTSRKTNKATKRSGK